MSQWLHFYPDQTSVLMWWSLALLTTVQPVQADVACLSGGAVFGIVCASAFTTAILIAAGLFVYYQRRKQRDRSRADLEKRCYDNAAYNKQTIATVRTNEAAVVVANNGTATVAADSSRSGHSLHKPAKVFSVHLGDNTLNWRTLQLGGNARDGIFVKNLKESGASKLSSIRLADAETAAVVDNTVRGSRLKALTINFDNLSLDKASKILALAEDYSAELQLEKMGSAFSLSDTKNNEEKFDEVSIKNEIVTLDRRFDSGKSVATFYSSENVMPQNQIKAIAEINITPSIATKPKLSADHPTSGGLCCVEIGDVPGFLPRVPAESESGLEAATEPEPVPRRNRSKSSASSSEHRGDDTPAPSTTARCDSYTKLSAEEVMDIMRLSYQDSNLSQSTPNLLDHAGGTYCEFREVTCNVHHRQEANDIHDSASTKLPCVNRACVTVSYETLGDHQAPVRGDGGPKRDTEAKGRPHGRGIQRTFEKPSDGHSDGNEPDIRLRQTEEIRLLRYEKDTLLETGGTREAGTASQRPQPQLQSYLSAPSVTQMIDRSPSDHPTAYRSELSIKAAPTALQELSSTSPPLPSSNATYHGLSTISVIESSPATTQITRYRDHSSEIAIDVDVDPVKTTDSGFSSQNVDSEETELSREHYERLRFFQEELAKQYKELARLGIAVPPTPELIAKETSSSFTATNKSSFSDENK